jgi:DNA polymerase
MGDDERVELARLSAAVRAYLEIEVALGNTGLPALPSSPPPEAQHRGALGRSGAPAEPRLDAAAGAQVAVPSPAPAPVAATSESQKHARLQLMAAEAAACVACALHAKRRQSVFARGSSDAELAFVGEGPGQEEDLQGLPFVGPAGQLLDRMIVAMGYGRDEVYVCNVVKCRPPDNRTPRPEEAIACARFLVPQLELVAPKIIVALGRCAAENLGVAQPGGAWRGRWGSWRGIPVMPTYHPAFLLRSPEFKRVVWEDLQQVMARLGRARPR